MRLYHGTNKEFLEIDLLKSKPNKDFGRGFYLLSSTYKCNFLGADNKQ